MSVATAEAVVERLRATFNDGRTRDADWRRAQLRGLRRMLRERETEFADALRQDLGKPALEAFVTETAIVRAEIDLALRKLRRWMRGERVAVPLALQPARARVVPQPLGVVLVIAPWNYPLLLLLAPLVGALAAGDCAVLKPSELAPATAAAMARWLPRYLDPDAVAVVEGDANVAAALLAQPRDHVFYTGGARVARIVAAAAAERLVPVTLELGGKSPAIVSDGDPLTIARRLVFGKFINAGQTCVAPDHVLVVAPLAGPLVEALRQVITDFFGDDPARSADYGRIVDERHFDRLVQALEGVDIAVGGDHDRATRYLAPTVVRDPPPDSPLLREEIFGPILPVIAVADVAAAIDRINAGPAPLSAYVFTHRSDVRRQVETQVRAGAIGINACAAQLAVPGLPFGGIGASGIGRYMGKHGFDNLSQPRPVFSKPTWVDTFRVAYPPYTSLKSRLLRWLM